MPDLDLQTYLARKRKLIDTALDSFLPGGDQASRVASAMRHSLMAGGKRLRPVLCMAAAEAVGDAAPQDTLVAGCAIEMIHTYSLIHDDLPAMDDDDLRRGIPTCHMAFDEATAILAGDALLTLAFEVLSSGGIHDAGKWRDVTFRIARAAGFKGMVEGQMQDMAAEGVTLDVPALEALHLLKTGAIIRAAVCCGTVLGGGNDEEIAALDRYALSIGLAFQVVDDILNVDGDPALMGKAVGTDAARHKSTYPLLLGMEASRKKAEGLVSSAMEALAGFDHRADPLRSLARYVIDRRK